MEKHRHQKLYIDYELQAIICNTNHQRHLTQSQMTKGRKQMLSKAYRQQLKQELKEELSA